MIHRQYTHVDMVEGYRSPMLDPYMLSWLGWSVDGSYAYTGTQSFAERSCMYLNAEFSGLKTRR